jgi:hypothetical protein
MNSLLAPRPLLSLRLLMNRTVMAGCGLAFFYFSEFRFTQSLDMQGAYLTWDSGVLSFSVPIFLFIPPGRPRPIGGGGGACNADILLFGNGSVRCHLVRHQIHKALQILCS